MCSIIATLQFVIANAFICIVLFSLYVNCIGDVHTSLAAIEKLAHAEENIVTILNKYLLDSDHYNNKIERYVSSWSGVKEALTPNPLSSYHLLKRLVLDYKEVLEILEHEGQRGLEVQRNLTAAKAGLVLPVAADLDGAAFALLRLQEVYDLPIDELIEGRIKDAPTALHLTADDCIRLGQQGFANLEFDLSEKWTNKGLELMRSEADHSDNVETSSEDKFELIMQTIEKRKRMRKFVEQLAKETPEQVLDRFSGMGLPTSFQKTMYSEREGSQEIDFLSEHYQRLCRGETLQSQSVLSTFSCGYVFRNEAYGPLMPFKAELVFHDPLLVLYHDVISQREIDKIKELAQPNLQTTEVHSFVTYKKMKSNARIGKTAWVSPGDSVVTDSLLRRIEDMTGLATDTAEPLHVLNYGVGGHYDAHIDFFDLASKSMKEKVDLGDRIATVLFYLNDVEAGGSTVFPSLGITVPARQGTALFWLNLKRNGHGDYRTLHASCPVLLGEKWIANLWLREGGQEFRWPCTTNPEE